jgi:hypothetical protein
MTAVAGLTLTCDGRPREVGLGWGAGSLQPAADVNLSMGFAAEVPRAGRIGDVGVPLVQTKFGFSATDDEPMNGSTGHGTADFATVFSNCGHNSCILQG